MDQAFQKVTRNILALNFSIDDPQNLEMDLFILGWWEELGYLLKALLFGLASDCGNLIAHNLDGLSPQVFWIFFFKDMKNELIDHIELLRIGRQDIH